MFSGRMLMLGMLVGNKITILAIVYGDEILRILKLLAVMTNSLLVLVEMR